MARRYGYSYEYKKMSYIDRPRYTTDVMLRVYVHYSTTDIPSLLPFEVVREQFISADDNYVIGDISLGQLMAARQVLSAPDVFLANIPMFFLDRDD